MFWVWFYLYSKGGLTKHRLNLHSALNLVPLNWVDIWAADFAMQCLSVLISTWEWVLCSCNDFHAECTETSYL